MNNNLARFDKDGLELLIDKNTGESFASVSGYARMVGLTRNAISMRITRNNIERKTAEILTSTGLKDVTLVTEDLIVSWLPKDNPELATQLLKLGVRKFLHHLAGYEPEPKRIESTAKENAETLQLIESLNDPLIKSLLREQLAQEMGCKQLTGSTEQVRLVAVDVRARELGVSQTLISRSKKRGYWSLGSVIARDNRFTSMGKVPLGSFQVNVYEITEELDDAILNYFYGDQQDWFLPDDLEYSN